MGDQGQKRQPSQQQGRKENDHRVPAQLPPLRQGNKIKPDDRQLVEKGPINRNPGATSGQKKKGGDEKE